MTAPYYSDGLVTLHLGDCREVTEWHASCLPGISDNKDGAP